MYLIFHFSNGGSKSFIIICKFFFPARLEPEHSARYNSNSGSFLYVYLSTQEIYTSFVLYKRFFFSYHYVIAKKEIKYRSQTFAPLAMFK